MTPEPLDLQREIDDELLLESVPGALDYLVAEIADLNSSGAASCTVLHRFSGALLVHYKGPLEPLAAIRYYSGCAVWLGTDLAALDPSRLRGLVDRSRSQGVIGLLEDGRTPGFRVAEDLGERRWPVREALVDDLGWINAPTDWVLNVRAYDDSVALEVGPLYQTARFGRLARIPASTTPVISAVLARLLKAEPGQLVLDPFCGAATNLLSAAQATSDVRLVGLDLHREAMVAARQNLAPLAPLATWNLVRGNAGRLPFAADSVDRVVSNIPFGKRVGSHRGNVELYPLFLRELSRVLTAKGRAVLLTEDKRLFVESVQRTAGLRVIKEIEFETGGLHPSAYVLVRGRSSGRRSGPARKRGRR
ncbi:TRM11 family SAM-dependent methyltransferase [Luteipulveratus mongoliensis]|uniref:Ribosomal RNA large subunit methyltransferase K/L-like methyltransferase domain-containing protein n=1 Tax=Luteipulveratus mongoliensis TaxID=571913 RepID=A0A0K1JPV2_9MICO|nr:methyltransferase domain-containing protein [Luteipulveratus mongoliensis]AKU18633.1 hypothetical protein VV02_04380 [Luteipulveratus mongoliensis]